MFYHNEITKNVKWTYLFFTYLTYKVYIRDTCNNL